MTYGIKVILAIVVLIVGLWIINRAVKVAGKVMDRKNVNVSIRGFLTSLFGISFDSNIKDAKAVLTGILQNHPKVLKDPAPVIGVAELADSSVNLAVRPYSKPEDYWDVYFNVYENGKVALDNAGITIPFPQLDVHIEK